MLNSWGMRSPELRVKRMVVTRFTTAVEILSPRWKYYHRGGNIPTVVEIFSPRWKYYHRCGNIITAVQIFRPRWKYFFQLIHNVSLEKRNLDFIVFQLIHVGSSSWFHCIQLFHYKGWENQACAQGGIAIMTHDFK